MVGRIGMLDYVTPAHVLFASSVPLATGAYLGYRHELQQASKQLETAAIHAKTGIHPAGPILAARALALGSLLSLGGVGLLSAGIFYASGHRSVPDMVEGWKVWAPQKRRYFESLLGVSFATRECDEDLKAISQMTEEQELEYVEKKYFSNHDTNHPPSSSSSKITQEMPIAKSAPGDPTK